MITISLLLAAVLQTGVSGFQELTCLQELSSLEKRLHKVITAKPELRNHLLCVRPNPTDPEAELTAIATALRAEIMRTEHGIVLGQTETDLIKARERWAQGRAKWIQQRIDLGLAFRKAHDADDAPLVAAKTGIDIALRIDDRFRSGDASGFADPGLSELLPAGKLVYTLLNRIGAQKLGALRGGSPCAVFETDPIGNGLPLPEHSGLLQAFNESTLLLREIKVPDNLVHYMRIPLDCIGPGSGSATRVRIECQEQPASFYATLEAFDDSGHLCGKAFFDARTFSGPIRGYEAYLQDYRQSRRNRHLEPIPSGLLSLAKRVTKAGNPTWFERPSEQEPLRIYASFAMESLAKDSPEPCVVIDMDDGLFETAIHVAEGEKLDLDGFQILLDHLDPYEQIHGQGFCAWRPADPDTPAPISRKELGLFVQHSLANGYMDLRELSGLTQHITPLLRTCTERLYKALALGPNNSEIHPPSQVTCKLIGAISDADWDALLAGRSLTAGQMGITDDFLKFLLGTAEFEGAAKLPEQYRHPTELYRGTSFADTPIHITRQDDAVYRILEQGKRPTRWDPVGPGIWQFGLRAHLVSGEPRLETTRDQFESKLDERFRFQTGKRSLLQMVLGLPKGQVWRCNLPNPIGDVSGSMRYSDLQRDIRDHNWSIMVQNAMATLHPEN